MLDECDCVCTLAVCCIVSKFDYIGNSVNYIVTFEHDTMRLCPLHENTFVTIVFDVNQHDMCAVDQI